MFTACRKLNLTKMVTWSLEFEKYKSSGRKPMIWEEQQMDSGQKTSFFGPSEKESAGRKAERQDMWWTNLMFGSGKAADRW